MANGILTPLKLYCHLREACTVQNDSFHTINASAVYIRLGPCDSPFTLRKFTHLSVVLVRNASLNCHLRLLSATPSCVRTSHVITLKQERQLC